MGSFVRFVWGAALAAAVIGACTSDEGAPPAPAASAAVASGSAEMAPPVAPEAETGKKAPERSGGALMRSADGARLYIADEDRRALRVVRIPVDLPSPKPGPKHKADEFPPIDPPPDLANEMIAMPGAPAQVLPLDGRVLVTIRDPGLLLVMKESPEGKLTEEARVTLPADAWGLAVTPDEKTAIVTSAWTHKVSGVALSSQKVLWTLDVAREPRGVVVLPQRDTAYVSHLTSGDLTRIDGLAGEGATAKVVSLPPAPTRTPIGKTVDGSLGYALVTDDAGHRVLASRHALGAMADSTWYGVPSIDVLQTEDDTPLLAKREREKMVGTTPAFDDTRRKALAQDNQFYWARQVRPPMPLPVGVQPRAMIVAHRTDSIWVASEGDDSVSELPLHGAAPTERILRTINVGRLYRDPKIFGEGSDSSSGIAAHCGAPTGLALSADENTLYVYCRSTNDLAAIDLAKVDDTRGTDERKEPDPAIAMGRLAPDTDRPELSRGRRLYYAARDNISSGGMGCAGCHPDGRDDGHVWHEVITDEAKHQGQFLASESLADKTKGGKLGHPRQTPMLAGRVTTKGPFGWKAQNPTFSDRMAEGFARHRWWDSEIDVKRFTVLERANVLGVFLKEGLVPPPRETRELTASELNGKKIFEDARSQCVDCHTPTSGFTNRAIAAISLPYRGGGFEEEKDNRFKTPSLLFVGGTAPYYHDGHSPTLKALIDQNADRMGRTSHLTDAERADLVAYLETL